VLEHANKLKQVKRGLPTGPDAVARIRQDGLDLNISVFKTLSDAQLHAAYYRVQSLQGSDPATDYLSLLSTVAKYASEIAPGRKCG